MKSIHATMANASRARTSSSFFIVDLRNVGVVDTPSWTHVRSWRRGATRPKLPAVGASPDKAGKHYVRLAALAAANRYPAVTRWVVQSWVKHGLLPKVGHERSGFGPPRVVVPTQLEDQLLALCRLRYGNAIRSHRLLRAALWAEGWEIATPDARDGLAAFLSTLARLADPAVRGSLAWAAAQPRNRPPNWKPAETARLFVALDELMARIGGAQRGLGGGLEEFAYLEEVTGLSRARTDRIAGTEPWLDTAPGAALAEGAEEASATRLIGVLANAPDADLDAARTTATELLRRLSVLIPALQLVHGTNAAGFGFLAPDAWSAPFTRMVLIVIVLAEPDGACELLNGLPGDEELSGIAATLDA